MKIFYIIDAFPSLSQIFISREIAVLESLGVEIGLLSIHYPQESEANHSINKQLRALRFYGPTLDCAKPTKALHHLRALALQPTKYLAAYKLSKTTGLPSMKYLFRDLPIYCNVILNFGAQHLHSHFGQIGMLVAWLAGRMLDLPFSVTLHGSDTLVYPYPALGVVLRDAKRVICVSEHIRKKVVSDYAINPARTELIHCGIDPNEFSPADNYCKSLRILTVARLHPIKGLQDLVSACALLRDKGICFRCTIVGEGEERSNIEAQIHCLRLESHIELLGGKANEELPSIYRQHSLFVLPSYSEGMPVVIMEAMASGLPVVATRVGGIPEIVENGVNGLLVETQNPEKITEAIIKLHNSTLQEKEEMLEKNRNKILEYFSSQREGEKIFRLFYENKGEPTHVC